MIDAPALRLYALVSLITPVVMGYPKDAFMVFTAVSLFLLALSFCIKPNKITLDPRNIFKDYGEHLKAVHEAASNPEFNNALQYVTSLSKADFLRFVRVSVEVRLKSDKVGLGEVADYLRGKR